MINNSSASSGKITVDCDLCQISELWIPQSPTEAQQHLVKCGWINLLVLGDRMDVCPSCQVVARALQIADTSMPVNPNAYPNAYEEPTA
jgi:hypothetical protein